MTALPHLLPLTALGFTLWLSAVPAHAQSFAPVSIAADRPAQRAHSGGYFTDSQRRALSAYYGAQPKSGHCPADGCVALESPRAWRKGQAVPQGLSLQPVNDDISLRLGLPPEGHRFVRAGADILLVSIGTGVVIDAIENPRHP